MVDWKAVGKWMDEPAVTITTIRRTTDDNEVQGLLEENKQLKKQLVMKKVEAIDIDFKLLE